MKYFLSALLLFVVPTGVSAHATPIEYSPEGYSTSISVPSAVLIRFSEPVDPAVSGIEVIGPNGERFTTDSAAVDPLDARIFSRKMADSGGGVYVVSWHVVSAVDGHYTKGAFSFLVGTSTSDNGVYAEVEKDTTETVPGQATMFFLLLLGGSLFAGSSLFMLTLKREVDIDTEFRSQVFMRARRMLVGAILFVAAGVLGFAVYGFPDGGIMFRTLAGHVFVVSVCVWVGVLLTHAFVLLSAIASQENFFVYRMRARSWVTLLLLPAVSITGASGVWGVWSYAGDIDMPTTIEVELFVATLLLLLMMLCLRTLALFVFDRMRRCIDCERSYAWLETAIGLCFLVVVALVCVLPPQPVREGHWSTMRMDSLGMIHIQDTGRETNMLRISVYDKNGVLIVGEPPIVVLDNSKENIGPLVIPAKARGDGKYDVPQFAFSPPGSWRIAITMHQKNAYDVSATLGIDYPREIIEAREAESEMNLGMSEFIAIGVGGIFLLVSFAFWYGRKRNLEFTRSHAKYDTDMHTIGKIKAALIAFLAFASVLITLTVLECVILSYSAGALGMYVS